MLRGGWSISQSANMDMILLDAEAGILTVKVEKTIWQQREVEAVDLTKHHYGMGRELFATFRQNATGAEEGAVSLGFE